MGSASVGDALGRSVGGLVGATGAVVTGSATGASVVSTGATGASVGVVGVTVVMIDQKSKSENGPMQEGIV